MAWVVSVVLYAGARRDAAAHTAVVRAGRRACVRAVVGPCHCDDGIADRGPGRSGDCAARSAGTRGGCACPGLARGSARDAHRADQRSACRPQHPGALRRAGGGADEVARSGPRRLDRDMVDGTVERLAGDVAALGAGVRASAVISSLAITMLFGATGMGGPFPGAGLLRAAERAHVIEHGRAAS